MIKLGSLCICDDCNNAMFTGVFIGALNRIYCDNCYPLWYERATFYEEDVPFENKATNRLINQVNS
uniref:Uncharacterized protein rgi82 n=1 Tax=Oryza sativa TaxID=4530 RepID=Q944E8_ORYSA|nr:hypothetical protein [Oryza sativa]